MQLFFKYLFFIQLLLLTEMLLGKPPKREFRGMWIATVNNIDWPSAPGMPVDKQQEELISMLNTLEEYHFNAVIFQIRPAGDAFYKSSTEPWSHWLTGTQGKSPPGNWDPLRFIIDECHKRGMELHAWMNPYRLSQNLTTVYSPRNIASRHPGWVLTYGNQQYLDPGIPGVRDYLVNVVSEVVRKYDVDAIHFDDYFYPYPIAGKSFPDTMSFNLHNRGYKTEQIEDWRRENVDLIIIALSEAIKSIKPKVKFGISPFGVWKNYSDNDEFIGSATTAGNTNYDNLYADVIKWQQRGWIDYLIPQLYWEIGHPAVDYITLANWWSERAFGRHMYIGHALYKAAEGRTAPWQNVDELPEQVYISRRMKNINGNAYFRMRFLDMNPLGFQYKLKNEIYTHRALLPIMPWIENQPPPQPDKIRFRGVFMKNKVKVVHRRKNPPAKDHLAYLFYTTNSKDETSIAVPENMVKFSHNSVIDVDVLDLEPGQKHFLWLTVIDKHHNESEPLGPLKIRVR
jgi:uncharacterized lipoprotein YddW (UPF0748 family)